MAATVFFHEFFHVFVASLFGFHTESIELFPFGGAAEIRGIEDNYIQEAIVASSGPLISLLSGFLWERGVMYALLPQADDFVSFSYNIAMINLLPIYPLDGGRVLMCALKGLNGDNKGRKQAVYIGIIFSSVFFLKCIFELVFFKITEDIVMASFMLTASLKTIKKPPSISLREKYWNNENVKIIKVQGNQKISDVLKNFNGNCFYCVIVVNKEQKIIAILTEKQVFEYALKDSTLTISQLIGRQCFSTY